MTPALWRAFSFEENRRDYCFAVRRAFGYLFLRGQDGRDLITVHVWCVGSTWVTEGSGDIVAGSLLSRSL